MYAGLSARLALGPTHGVDQLGDPGRGERGADLLLEPVGHDGHVNALGPHRAQEGLQLRDALRTAEDLGEEGGGVGRTGGGALPGAAQGVHVQRGERAVEVEDEERRRGGQPGKRAARLSHPPNC